MGLHIRIGQNPHGLRRKIVPIFPGLQTFRVLSPDHLQRAFAEENLRGGFSASTTASMASAVASGLSRAMVLNRGTLIAPLRALRTGSAQNQQAIETSRREYDAHLKNGK
jgi:hypothetical protein